jgi:tetratricopeptide (TPR) repeat protein
MAEKKPREKKKKWDFPVGLKPVTPEEADAAMADFFMDLEARLKEVPKEEIEKGSRKIKDYIDGKIGWSELFNFTPQMLYQMAEFGYTQFKVGRYEDAERVFKVLTVLDWNNHYYHSMMGTILQRQKRFGEAIAEYSQAIELHPQDVVSLTNRGEIFLQHGLLTEAEVDLSKAIALDPKAENKWANRARMLFVQLEKKRKKG